MCFRPAAVSTAINCPDCGDPLELGVEECDNCGAELTDFWKEMAASMGIDMNGSPVAPAAPKAPGAPVAPQAPAAPKAPGAPAAPRKPSA